MSDRCPTSPNFQKKLYFEPNLASPNCITLVLLVLWVLKTIFFFFLKKGKKSHVSTFDVIRISMESPKGIAFNVSPHLEACSH